MPRTHQGHQAKKRFGQNFLVDQGIIAAIVAAIAPVPGDNMVEIGPGLGALTGPLVEKLGHLSVVEIDRDIVARLRKRFRPQHLDIHEGDALSLDFGKLGQKLRVVGNLPYNISTPLLFHLADFAEQIRDMHFMLQEEVVERMVAQAGSTDYGRLSVMLQYRFMMAKLFTVPPESFEPAPRVDSAIVRMMPKPAAELAAQDERMLAHVVSSAFSQRRKMLRNTLKGVAAESDLERLAIPPTARAEDVTVADYVRLANLLASRQELVKSTEERA
jgi:16S rRNA (adenine1518-N6/adenine1519-N6)-dimethyltransferase